MNPADIARTIGKAVGDSSELLTRLRSDDKAISLAAIKELDETKLSADEAIKLANDVWDVPMSVGKLTKSKKAAIDKIKEYVQRKNWDASVIKSINDRAGD